MYMMLVGYMPFNGNDNNAILRKVIKCDYSLKGKEWNEISKEGKDLIK